MGGSPAPRLALLLTAVAVALASPHDEKVFRGPDGKLYNTRGQPMGVDEMEKRSKHPTADHLRKTMMASLTPPSVAAPEPAAALQPVPEPVTAAEPAVVPDPSAAPEPAPELPAAVAQNGAPVALTAPRTPSNTPTKATEVHSKRSELEDAALDYVPSAPIGLEAAPPPPCEDNTSCSCPANTIGTLGICRNNICGGCGPVMTAADTAPPPPSTSSPDTPTATPQPTATLPLPLPVLTKTTTSTSESTFTGTLLDGVSVCVPCIPRDLQILRTSLLPSIQSQIKQPNEVVVALSETPAKSAAEIQAAVQHEFPALNVRFVATSEKQAPGLNRNRAASAARSKIVSFFDADDLMHPQRLQIIYDVMNEHSAACVVHSFSTSDDIFQEHLDTRNKVSDLQFTGAMSINRLTEMVTRASHFVSAAEERKEAWPLEHHGHVSCVHHVTDQVKFDGGAQAEDTHFTAKVKAMFNGTKFVALPLSVYKPSWTFPEVKMAVDAYGEVEDIMRHKMGMHSE